ncbi:MAG: hypothetical protein HQ483_02875 [Rhodospirillales bacterium]|nr:hypothetical protein [Rhodospirillales bacterium]
MSFEETDLYPPVKAYLEAAGYTVKAEVNTCDVVGKGPDGSLVIVELKKGFNLDLLIQGVERLSLADDVYIAAGFTGPIGKGAVWNKRRRGILKLCRRLGLGLMMVRLHAKKDATVNVLLDPAAYSPRKNASKVTRLKKEFETRVGDPNAGGATRTKIMTAYRQAAIRCAELLLNSGPMRIRDIRDQARVEKAATLLRNNHYGWFEKIERGVYCLTDQGKNELAINREESDSI